VCDSSDRRPQGSHRERIGGTHGAQREPTRDRLLVGVMRTWVILAAVVFFASLLGAAVGTALVLIYAPWLAWYGLLPSRW
jgi:hypothetical protein